MLRSSSVPVPLRVLALFIVVSALVLTTLATALADSHPAAADGQRLEDQSAEVQALYRAVYGDDAEARWIAEHNAAIGMSMMDDMMMGDMSMDDMSNMYYDRIVAVAMARGADAELANRIAADVISRGTEAEFLAGTDEGVLYGVGTSEDDINNPPAPAAAPAASSGGGGGTPGPATNDGEGLLEGKTQKDLTVRAGTAIGTSPNDAITLPATTTAVVGYGDPAYSAIGLPPGLSFANADRGITGTTTVPGTYHVTYMVSRTDAVPDTDPALPQLTGTLRFTITVEAESAPSFGSTTIDNISVLTDSGDISVELPEAMGGNAELTYAINDLSGGDASWVKFDKDTRMLSGTAPSTAHAAVTVTYTVTDNEGTDAAGDDDTAELTFTVTVVEDTTPTIAAPTSGLAATVGQDFSLTLDAATAGTENGDITYSVSGLPPGLSFDPNTRQIYGTPSALPDGLSSQGYVVSFMATDEQGDEGKVTFTITVSSS